MQVLCAKLQGQVIFHREILGRLPQDKMCTFQLSSSP